VEAIMRKIGKTLYLINEDNYVNIENNDLIITDKENSKTRIPAILIETIVVFGNTTITSPVLRFCSQNDIDLSYVSTYGKFYGRFVGEFNRCIVLRKQQYDMYNSDKAMLFCKNLMLAKFINSKNVLLQAAKDSIDTDKKERLINAANKISSVKDKLQLSNDYDSLLGIEGFVAQTYFSVFDDMLKTKDEKMLFIERSKRPPQNYCNCLLSFFYTLYTNDITAALETTGLDAYLGFNHKLHPGRRSLSLDLLEEFRACIIDRFVITCINRKQVTAKDFENREEGIRLTDEGRKKCIQLWENYKSQEIQHKYYNKKVEIKLLPYLQAQLLAQYIRGDIEEYPPFVK
jgi:CRISPR-associated protein Cas1